MDTVVDLSNFLTGGYSFYSGSQVVIRFIMTYSWLFLQDPIFCRILAGLHNKERLTGSYIGSYQGGKVGRILHRILSERKVGRILRYNFSEMNFL